MNNKNTRNSVMNKDEKRKPSDHNNNNDLKNILEAKDEEDILNLLPRKNLSIIEKQFPKEEGLCLEDFVKTLLVHLEYNKDDPEKRLQITLNLIELFKEIDVNGDETMEWEEFSNYIIELGMIKKDRNIGNVIKNYNPSENIKDTAKHDNEIEKLYYFNKTKQLFVIERDSPNFKVYDDSGFNLIADIPAHKGAILSADCYEDDNYNDIIVTTSDDLTINFWEASNFSLKQRISTPELQLCVRHARWSNSTSLIYTGGSDALIHYYDARTYKPKGHLSGWNPFFKKDTQQFGHAGPITDILPIYEYNTLASCATDGKICLWDIPSHAYKKDLLGHEKGVFCLDWSEEHRFIFSAGLDHEAYVWNTYVSDKINLLRGHNHPLVGVKVCPGTPQVITADISGMVKIWDIRNFLCVQTFNVPCDELNAFTITHPKKRIIAGARHLNFYEYDEPKDQNLADEKICLRVLYNDVMFIFITLHPDCVKLWEAKSGKLLTIHREISKAELSACCLDERQRKLIVGDVEGRIYCINVKNGARMKKFEKHKQEQITDLVYWVSGKNSQININSKLISSDFIQESDKKNDKVPRLISSSKGKMVKVHDDSSSETKHCRYSPEVHQNSVNGLAINRELGLVASYSDDGTVVIINLISYRQEGHLKPPGKENELPEVKRAVFLSPDPFLVTCDAGGKLTFWASGTDVFTTYYEIPSITNKSERFAVNAMAYNSNNNYLYFGDLFGNVTAWNIGKLVNKLRDLTRNTEKWKNWKAKRDGNLGGVKKTQFMDTDNAKDNSFITSVHQDEDLSDNDIVKVFQIKKAHNDGITWIEVIDKYDCIATSSFDCRVHVWSNQGDPEFKKPLGSLMMAHDENWSFKVDEEKRNQDNLEFAKDLLKKIENDQIEIQRKDSIKKEMKKKATTLAEPVMKLIDHQIEKEYTEKKQLEDGDEEDYESKDSGSKTRLTKEQILYEAQDRLLKFRRQLHENTYGYYTEASEEKDVFAEDDEEDQDYQILHELDFKTTQVSPAMSKGIFKSSKPLKSHVKLKFK